MRKKTKVAFLDWDEFINSCKVNREYIGLIKYFKWKKGVNKIFKYLKLNNYKVVIVTNQSGVVKGYFSI